MHSFDNSSLIYIQTRDYSLGQSHTESLTSSIEIFLSYSALPRITAKAPHFFTLIVSCRFDIPPLAIIFAPCIWHAFLRESKSGPCRVPSRSTLVNKNSEYPSFTKFSIPDINSIPVFSVQPLMTIFP